MELSQLQQFWPVALVLAFLAFRAYRFRAVKKRLPALLAAGAVVLDVRSRAEYGAGAREGSVNIPLDELEKGAAKLDPTKPVLVCCASGTRSAMAATVLKRKGFHTVINAGPWTNTLG